MNQAQTPLSGPRSQQNERTFTVVFAFLLYQVQEDGSDIIY